MKLRIPTLPQYEKSCNYCNKILFYEHDNENKLITTSNGICLNKLCYNYGGDFKQNK